MPPAPKKKSDGPTPRSGTPKSERPAEKGDTTTKKPSAKRPAKAKPKVDEHGSPVQGEEQEPERVQVYLKISSNTGNSVSSCVGCDPKTNSVWSLDFDGHRSGAPVSLDGVYTADQPESAMYQEVVNRVANDFVSTPHGVACLLCYGQADAGKETIMYGDAGSRMNFTPRGLPAPGGGVQPQHRAPGLVLHSFRTVLSHLPVLQQAGVDCQVEMGCVMLHMELMKDLLSPQSRIKLTESEAEGVQLDGMHWQAISDDKEAEGLLQLATQNKAVHTLQADNGFLDACHIITAIRMPTMGGAGAPPFKIFYMVELASPPLPRPSGVAGLNVEDFCALNSSLRGLIASLGAMARKGAARPPLRDSKLTRILSGGLGSDCIRTNLLLCVSQQRQHAETTAELLSFGALAKSARLTANVYESAAPRALCSQLQADLATIEAPNDETYNEMLDQMRPQQAQLEKLAAAASALRAKHRHALEGMASARGSFESKLQQLSMDSDAMQTEVQALSEQNDALRQQVRAVRMGEGIEVAMEALRESDARELSALSKQVNALQERLNSAKQEQARLASNSADKSSTTLADTSNGLVDIGKTYVAQGKLLQAYPVLNTALLSAEIAHGAMHKSVVAPLAALAELHIAQKREEEAIALLKRAYTVDKEALGPDAPEVGQHLIGLGTAYHSQGKLEAAALTLEEARSILVYALGADHPQVTVVKEKIKKLSVIEVDMQDGAAATPQQFVSRMEARLASKHERDEQLTLEDINKKKSAADLRRLGLLSARGSKAGQHFDYASHVAERVTSEQEKRAAGERRELLQKKKALFRERLKRRPSQMGFDEDEGEEEAELEDDSPETMAQVESEMTQVLGRSGSASSTEDWAVVVDCATKMEELMQSCRNKSKGAAACLRVLRSGIKTIGADESRARSAIAILMMMEWCVPVCDSSFRQALSGERWVRRLVELARKDGSEKMLVRSTVQQLLVNWASWYGTGFEAGVEMLKREGYTLPEPSRIQDGTETPRGLVGNDPSGPILLGQAAVGRREATTSENEVSVKAEMSVMREDLELLRRAVQARKAGTLLSIELAEARQASNDCSGWLGRLAQLLGSTVGGGNTARRTADAIANFTDETKEALRTLQQEMAELNRTFQAAFPGRKGFSALGTPRAGGNANQLQTGLQLGQTPRTRQLFMSDGGGDKGGGNNVPSLADFFGVPKEGDSQQVRARAQDPSSVLGQQVQAGLLSSRKNAATDRGARATEEGGATPPCNSPRGGDSAPSKSGNVPPVVPKLRLGGGDGGLGLAAAEPPKLGGMGLNLSGMGGGDGGKNSARGLQGDDPPSLDLGMQLEIDLGGEDGFDEPSASSQMFMQEVAILQMQAEGWKAEWSIAMQENERLRMALYDAQTALEALPPKEDGAPPPDKKPASEEELQWRELCTSIARAADEEKAALLEELNKMRVDLDQQLTNANTVQNEMQRAEVEANKARGNAEHWKGQLDQQVEEHSRVLEALRTVEARTADAQATSRGNEQGGAATLMAWKSASKKRNEEEQKLQSKKREAEARLTAVYNSHRQQIERLQFEIRSKKTEQVEIAQQLSRWRTQWEEEMTEKNAVAAELLTLRSEFEKSSATYDKEIEGLKDLLERLRLSTGEMREKWEESVTLKNALMGQLDETERELARSQQNRVGEQERMNKERLAEAQESAAKWTKQAEEAVAQEKAKASELAELQKASEGAATSSSQAMQELQTALSDAKVAIEVGVKQESTLADLDKELARLQEEHDSLVAFTTEQKDKLFSDATGLQSQLAETRERAEKLQQQSESTRGEKDLLSDELAGLKAEVEELTVSHDLEVERLQERLGQLQTVQDKLELQLSEKRKEHEKTLLDMDTVEEQKGVQMKEAQESAQYNLKESQTMLHDAKAALKKELKSKQDALDATKETKQELEDVLKEARQKEAELNTKVTEEGTVKERLEASLASDRVQSEEAVSTLRTQLTEAKGTLREAEAKATEFAKEYGKEFYLRKQIAEQLQEMTGGLRVFCRVRPPTEGEGEAEVAVKALDETTVLVEDQADSRRPRRRFEFNQVYGPTAEQAKVFEDVRPMIAQTLQGFNICALMHGAQGSGKTYTMEGTAAEPGLLHRCVNAIFEEITGVDESMSYEVFLSLLEIVDEGIRDLQLPEGTPQPTFKLVRDTTYGMQVENLSTSPVHTASHVRSLLTQAQASRTKMGSGESGSNLVATLTIRSSNTESGESSVGKLTLVDLMDAEGATAGTADEPRKPNQGLVSLFSVVDSLTGKQKSKPKYDESKLTELLQDSLGGNSKTMMFITVAPTLAKASVSSDALAFGVKARSISLGPASKNKESMQTAMHKVNTTMMAAMDGKKK